MKTVPGKKSKKSPKPSISTAKSRKPINKKDIWLGYMDWVMNDLKGRSHAFRGQADASWPVQASAYRRLVKKGIKHPELAEYLVTGYLHERVNEVMMRFTDHNKRYPLEVMAWMQHYGFATGLIDFTESALVALWFACKDKQGTSGKVIAVRLDNNEKIKEIKNRDDTKGPLESFFPIKPSEKLQVWRPGDSDSRMITQQSLFIFGVPEIIEKNFIIDDFLVQAEEKGVYMEILKRMGISESSIYSDFSGFAAANASDKDYELDLAEIYYAEKVNKEPENSLYHFQKGVFNAARGAYREAVSDYNKAIEIDPQNAVAYSNRGSTLQDLGRPEEAVSDYNKAIEIDPQNAVAYSNRGHALHALDRHTEAIENYNRAIEIDPQNAVAYSNRGSTLQDLGRPEEAVSDCNKAIEIDPQNAVAYSNRGHALHALDRHTEAIENYNKAIEIDPQNAVAYSNRGSTLQDLGRPEEAVSDCNKAIEIDPQNTTAYYNRGSALHSLGYHTEAIEDFNKAIEIDPQNTSTYNNRGSALHSLGYHTEAIEDFNKAIEIDPQNTTAYNNRGTALEAVGRREEAISDWQEAIRIGEKTGNREIVQKATANLAHHARLK